MSKIIAILCAQAIIAYNQVSTKESSACYGTNIACDFYSLECMDTELIRLNTLQYGYKQGKKCHKNEACKNDGGCCRYEKSDCTNKLHEETMFGIYTNCSGKSKCGPFQAPWWGMSYCGPLSEVITSDYLAINYDCIDREKIMDICHPQELFTDHVYLSFDGSKKIGANVSLDGACSCTFTGVVPKSATSLTVTIIDVRLAKSVKRLSDCMSTRLKIHTNIFERKCTFGSPISNFYQNLNLEYILTNDTFYISLEGINSNDTTDRPAMIWLQVEGNNSFHLSCNKYQSSPEQLTVLPELLNDVSVAANILTPLTKLTEPSDSPEKSTISSKMIDDSIDKNASHLEMREAVGEQSEGKKDYSGDTMKTESSTALHPKTNIENKSEGQIITSVDTANLNENSESNDSMLHQKDATSQDVHSDNGQLVVSIVIPFLTGVLMTFVVIISVYVKCRTRKKTGKYKTNASEGTYLDEESELETPNGALSSSLKPEAVRDIDQESTKL